MQSKNTIRLNKFIAESGICSRREADRHIQAGRVLINRKKANIGDLVHNNDKVIVNGLHLEPRIIQDNIYIALNKPVGITSTTEETTPGNIINHVNHSTRIFPIGRLDKDSQGLILLTNDGDILNKILRAENAHEKEYLVTVSTPITDQFITTMANGIPILGGTTKKCHVEKISPYIFKIILIQGLNRQIRRMCEHLQYTVTKLERTRIMNITIKGIPPGEWRDLTKTELNGILKLIENSTSQNHSTQHQEKPKPTKIFHKTKPPYQSKTTHRNEATPPKRKDKKNKPTDHNRPTQKTRRRR